MLFKSKIFCYNREVPIRGSNLYGVWRSLVARSAGGREVAGSNPVTPTKRKGAGGLIVQDSRRFYFIFCTNHNERVTIWRSYIATRS